MRGVSFRSAGLCLSLLPAAVGAAGCLPPGTGPEGETTLYVHAVLAADDDGSDAVEFPLDSLQSMLEGASEIYGDDAGIRFELAAVSRVWSDDINRLSPESGAENCVGDVDRAKDAAKAVAERNEFDGKIVVFFRKFQYVNRGSGCALVDPGTAFSWKTTPYIAMGSSPWQGADFAHEAGHYLGLPHTFNRTPATEAELVLDVVVNGTRPTWREDLYDGDGIADTYPDPGTSLYSAVEGVDGACKGDGDIAVNIPGLGLETFVFDRHNVMSYFKGCPKYWSREDRAILSGGQTDIVWNLLAHGRSPLLSYEPASGEPEIEPEVLSPPGEPGGAPAELPTGGCAAAAPLASN